MTARKKKLPSPNAVLNAIREAGKSLNVTELATEMLEAFGGPKEFAATFRAEFDAAPSGGVAKSKMLECVTRMVSQAHARNKDALDDLSQFDDADLRTLFHQLMAQAPGPEQPAAADGSKKTKS